MVALATPFVRGHAVGRGVEIETGGAEPMRMAATLVVNAAGLGGQAIAGAIDGMPAEKIPPLHLAKGNYFSLSRPHAVLSVDLPDAGGGRPRHTPHARPSWSGAVRAGRRVGRDDRLRRRSPAS